MAIHELFHKFILVYDVVLGVSKFLGVFNLVFLLLVYWKAQIITAKHNFIAFNILHHDLLDFVFLLLFISVVLVLGSTALEHRSDRSSTFSLLFHLGHYRSIRCIGSRSSRIFIEVKRATVVRTKRRSALPR